MSAVKKVLKFYIFWESRYPEMQKNIPTVYVTSHVKIRIMSSFVICQKSSFKLFQRKILFFMQIDILVPNYS